MLLITFYSSECLSIKGAEQLRVPSPWLAFLMLDAVKMVCSVVENFGDDKGGLPKLERACVVSADPPEEPSPD